MAFLNNHPHVTQHFLHTSKQILGGWGWKRSGAESPTGNPSPAPIAIAPHASHARHDRSMARWISVVRAKVGGRSCSPPPSRKNAPSSTCPFVRFEQGNIMVSLRTRSSPLTKIRVSWLFVHLSKELQWFAAHPLAECSSHQGIIRVLWIIVDFSQEFQRFFVRLPFKLYFRLRPATKSIKTASGAPRPKSAPRGSKSTTFAQGKFQVSNRQKMVANPIGEPSVSPFQYPIYIYGSKLQLEKLLGGWCVVSCKSIQFQKFMVQA